VKELVDKLIADLRWRFTQAGRPYKPTTKEIQSWGTLSIPWSVPLLLWPVGWALWFGIFALIGAQDLEEGLMPLLIIATLPLLYWLRTQAQRSSSVRCYKKLLQRNERFVLAEYSRFLKRQIARAQLDPALGGDAEVRRLYELQQRMQQLLKQELSIDGQPLPSTLAAEANLAQSVIEVYEAGTRDPLADLDARLPTELRQRMEDLDRQVGPSQRQRESR
jgi:hypothetical protein